VLSQSVQNLLNMMKVLCPILVVYEDVIQIHHQEKIGERMQDIVHHSHEICWGIHKTKGHDQPFKNTFFGIEGSFPYIYLLYWDLMVARIQINLTKIFGPLELVKEIIDSGNKVPIPDYDFIWDLVIDVESPGPVFLLKKNNLASTR
jgi:hypothetical protein